VSDFFLIIFAIRSVRRSKMRLKVDSDFDNVGVAPPVDSFRSCEQTRNERPRRRRRRLL